MASEQSQEGNKSSERNIGRLLVIGGAEDKDEEKMTILPHFVKSVRRR